MFIATVDLIWILETEGYQHYQICEIGLSEEPVTAVPPQNHNMPYEPETARQVGKSSHCQGITFDTSSLVYIRH